MSAYDNDNMNFDDPNEPTPPEESSNRTFLLVGWCSRRPGTSCSNLPGWIFFLIKRYQPTGRADRTGASHATSCHDPGGINPDCCRTKSHANRSRNKHGSSHQYSCDRPTHRHLHSDAESCHCYCCRSVHSDRGLHADDHRHIHCPA